MAKSVVLQEEWVSRPQRRWMERHDIIPRPWHIVKLDPKIISHKTNEEVPYHHQYRYDVIGHLRFNKHRIKEGYRSVIEWVPDHQRGLANELYIPKTYKIESGRKIATKQMQEYFGEGEGS